GKVVTMLWHGGRQQPCTDALTQLQNHPGGYENQHGQYQQFANIHAPFARCVEFVLNNKMLGRLSGFENVTHGNGSSGIATLKQKTVDKVQANCGELMTGDLASTLPFCHRAAD